jgi:hypothetical protein
MEGMTTRGSNRNAFGNLQNVNGELVLRKKARQPVRENERKRETPRDEANREIETGEKWHQLPVLKNPFQVPLDDKRLHLQKHIEHIDDEKDPNEVPEYAFTAFEYFRAREQAQPITDYINDQGEINEKMRQVLVDWLVEMQESFQLAHETLYLAVVMTICTCRKRRSSETKCNSLAPLPFCLQANSMNDTHPIWTIWFLSVTKPTVEISF